jgi:hypothetical protein
MKDRLCEQIENTLSRWQGDDVRRREAGLPVWDIRWPTLLTGNRRQRLSAVTACRQELLAALLTSGRPLYLTHQEPPESYWIPGAWIPAGPATWLVPPDFDPQQPDAKHWLFSLGGWSLQAAPGPVTEDYPDVFHTRALDLLAWMRKNSVRAMITSSLDDTEWVVAIDTA